MHQYKILLVDDEEDMLIFLERLLSSSYQITKAAEVQRALEVLGQESVHLIISDVMMPGMDGFEFCQTIKSNLEYSHIPFILLTAKDTLQAKIEGLEIGADAYIEKPFSKKYLLAQIHSLLANRSRIKEHFNQSPLSHIRSLSTSAKDEQFLNSVNDVIVNNLADKHLGVELIAGALNMSRATLYRKIVATTDLTPVELINLTRLKKAASLLAENKYKMYEVAYKVGYVNQSSFTRSFYRQFNISPSDYVKSIIE